MFYVIDGRKLQAVILVILLLALAIWVAVLATSRDGTTLSDKLVFWQQFTGRLISRVDDTEGTSPVSQSTEARNEDEVEMSAMTVSGGTLVRAGSEDLVSVRPVEHNDQFAEFRMERERNRSQQIEYLRELAKTGEESNRQQAEKDISQILQNTDLETKLEGLIKARGFADALVVINDGNVNILVKQLLNEQQAGQIGDMAARVTGIAQTKVKIVDEVE